jgi:hypothetical protein
LFRVATNILVISEVSNISFLHCILSQLISAIWKSQWSFFSFVILYFLQNVLFFLIHILKLFISFLTLSSVPCWMPCLRGDCVLWTSPRPDDLCPNFLYFLCCFVWVSENESYLALLSVSNIVYFMSESCCQWINFLVPVCDTRISFTASIL